MKFKAFNLCVSVLSCINLLTVLLAVVVSMAEIIEILKAKTDKDLGQLNIE